MKKVTEMTNMVMVIVVKYIEELFGELINVIEKSSMETFTKKEVVAILKVHLYESVIRIKKTIVKMGD